MMNCQMVMVDGIVRKAPRSLPTLLIESQIDELGSPFPILKDSPPSTQVGQGPDASEVHASEPVELLIMGHVAHTDYELIVEDANGQDLAGIRLVKRKRCVEGNRAILLPYAHDVFTLPKCHE